MNDIGMISYDHEEMRSHLVVRTSWLGRLFHSQKRDNLQPFHLVMLIIHKKIPILYCVGFQMYMTLK